MDRDTIIQLAQETIFDFPNEDPFDFTLKTLQQLERFAELVASQAVMNAIDASIKVLMQRAVQAEREECAKLCDEVDRRWINQADKCAQAIRSRT